MAGYSKREGQGGEGMTQQGIHLTDREVEVLRLAAQGKGASKIAFELKISPDRVKRIRRHIREQFGLRGRVGTKAILRRARQLGFIS